jgi:Flp pilus assembly protein CpaB
MTQPVKDQTAIEQSPSPRGRSAATIFVIAGLSATVLLTSTLSAYLVVQLRSEGREKDRARDLAEVWKDEAERQRRRAEEAAQKEARSSFTFVAAPREKVLVAKMRIPAYTLFKEEDADKWFVEKEVPVSIIPKQAVRNLKDLKGKRNPRVVPEDDFITSDNLIVPRSDSLATTLPPGMRAVPIRVTPESLGGGFVIVGSHVDVLLSVRSSEGVQTKTILQDMLVLSVDSRPIRSSDEPPLGNTVILAAWPDEVEILSLAGRSGDLSLSLRPIGDTEKQKLKGARTNDLEKPPQDVPELPRKEDR